MPLKLHLIVPTTTTEEIDTFVEELIEIVDKSSNVTTLIIDKCDSNIPVVQILIKHIQY